jgi:hypothetical protein
MKMKQDLSTTKIAYQPIITITWDILGWARRIPLTTTSISSFNDHQTPN